MIYQNPIQITPVQSLLINTENDSVFALQNLRAITILAFDRMWRSGHTAEMLQELGTNATKVFAQHAATVQFILESAVRLNEPSLMIDPMDYTPPLEYSVNEDGTITLI